QLLLNRQQTDQDFINAVNQVTKKDVIKLANEAVLDTIYVLTKGDQH
ncbi:insulinase family protein, partial [Staphylococcus epidermidis]